MEASKAVICFTSATPMGWWATQHTIVCPSTYAGIWKNDIGQVQSKRNEYYPTATSTIATATKAKPSRVVTKSGNLLFWAMNMFLYLRICIPNVRFFVATISHCSTTCGMRPFQLSGLHQMKSTFVNIINVWSNFDQIFLDNPTALIQREIRAIATDN